MEIFKIHILEMFWKRVNKNKNWVIKNIFVHAVHAAYKDLSKYSEPHQRRNYELWQQEFTCVDAVTIMLSRQHLLIVEEPCYFFPWYKVTMFLSF